MNSSMSCRACSGSASMCLRKPARSRCSSSTCAAIETYSPTAIEQAPATSDAMPASSTNRELAEAPATPRMSDTLVTSPSLTPSTAARVAPLCTSRARRRDSISASAISAPLVRDARSGHLQDPAQLLQRRQRGILGGEDRIADRPGDARRVPPRADLVGPVVEVGALVLDLGHPAEHAEPVRESGRDEDLPEVVRAERRSHPPAEGLRARPDVHRHVEDLALDGADQLSLRLAALRVQAAQRPLRGSRLVVLHEVVRDPALAIFGGVEGLEEEAARVVEHLGLDQQHARKLGLDEAHLTFRSGIRARAR